MISCAFFYNELLRLGINFFCGVPDSLLKSICAYIAVRTPNVKHIITPNEGNAVALAAGHFLATGNPALVYMQNSGLGNALNPLVSLVDPDVYNIPVLLLIGWRGEPGVKDEPQHIKQGKITLSLIETMQIPFEILPAEEEAVCEVLTRAGTIMRTDSKPFALVVKQGTFTASQLPDTEDNNELTRENALQIVCRTLSSNAIIISTTGKISRELYEYRTATGMDFSRDFLTVGSMGHVSQIALGIALEKPQLSVYCFDGDGAAIMHMGCLGINGTIGLCNFKHVIFNNGTHDSVGGQPTIGFKINFIEIARACGYRFVFQASSPQQLSKVLEEFNKITGPALLEIRVKKGARKDLGRPQLKLVEIKNRFMGRLQEGK